MASTFWLDNSVRLGVIDQNKENGGEAGLMRKMSLGLSCVEF